MHSAASVAIGPWPGAVCPNGQARRHSPHDAQRFSATMISVRADWLSGL
jgi:hypothetical protein